jgi:hypothetical protein
MRDTRDNIVALSEGANRSLDCCVNDGTYPPASIFWRHNGSFIANGESLHMRDLDEIQTGVYKCTAYNGHGIPVSKSFYVFMAKVRPLILNLNFPSSWFDSKCVMVSSRRQYPSTGRIPIEFLFL